MKFLLRSAMLLIFALSVGTAMNAQDRGEAPQVDVSELTASLDLTPDQSAQIEDLEIRFAAKKNGILKTSPNADEAAANMKELKSSYFKELTAILSPEQLEKWKAMQPQDGK